MKKIFLSFGILGIAGTAVAQQNDLFDVQEHLKKKTTLLFLNKPADFNLRTLKNPTPTQSLSFIYPASGEKLIQLPVDHMPCVVPDMELFRIMPNAADGITFRTSQLSIPNPAPPLHIK